jgi:hypothetical protein
MDVWARLRRFRSCPHILAPPQGNSRLFIFPRNMWSNKQGPRFFQTDPPRQWNQLSKIHERENARTAASRSRICRDFVPAAMSCCATR